MIKNIEFIQDFVDESKEHMEKVKFILLEKNINKIKKSINDLFRAVHSIKGTASFFGVKKVVALSHGMENVFGEIRAGNLEFSENLIDVMLQSNDLLKLMINNIFESEKTNIDEVLYEINLITESEVTLQSESVCVEKDEKTDDDSAPRDYAKEFGLGNVEESEKYEKNSDSMQGEDKFVKAGDSVRVHVNILNDLLNMASEMVLGRNQLLRILDGHKNNISGLGIILQNIDRLTSGMQEKIMQTRMQPIGKVFNKFPRMIRELSKSMGKSIDFKIEGAEVELDKSMIEALADPLTHIVRNAVDHGLETSKERKKVGKALVGCITMKAYHEGGYVNIDVVDDGSGIDVESIKTKAISNDLIGEAEVNQMSEKELLNLIFRPGFSTNDKVTDISGRGVGMDVVKTNVEKLGGTVEIYTSKGKGTTMRLLIPLTLAIIQSLIVEVEGQRFALPQANLQEIVRIKKGDLARKIEYVNDSEVLRLRGRLLPIANLADILGVKRTYTDVKTGEIKPENRKSISGGMTYNEDDGKYCKRDKTSVIRVMVVKAGSKRIGVIVDSILGSEETLVKPLPIYLKECVCYSGVTIMGDGMAAMIIDPEGIIRNSQLNFRDELEKKLDEENKILEEEMTETQNLLVFKCSGKENFAIDLSMVSRVEKIDTEEIEVIGEKEYIKFRGDSLRIIRPEDFLPVTKEKGTVKKMHVIIPKLIKYPIGILVENIVDNFSSSLVLNTEEFKEKGIVGSAIINEKIVIVVNLYGLFEKADPVHYGVENTVVEKNKTILLAEDTAFFQSTIASYLKSAGYNVIVSQNGKKALEVLNNTNIDLVVSDIEMPVMNGLELVRKIRDSREFGNIPVIAVTSLSGKKQKETGLEAGFDFYEFKLDRDRLIKTVEQAFKKHKTGVI